MSFFRSAMFSKILLIRRATAISIARKLLWLTITLLTPLWSQLAFGSALADLAGSMQPGKWAELVTSNFQNGAILLDGGGGGYATQYTDRILWDSFRKRLYFIGQAHQGPSTNGTFLKYEESTNTWTSLQSGKDYWGALQAGPTHSYNEATIVPSTGKIYYRRYYTGEVHTYDLISDRWSKEIPDFNGPYSLGDALCYFPERNGLYHFDGDWGIKFYSFTTKLWSSVATSGRAGTYPTGGYHVFCQYNPVRQEILFGGGSGYGNANKIHRVNLDGSITTMASPPAGVEFNRNAGMGHLAVVDPVTETYLFITTDSSGAGTFRAFNSTTNSWSVITGQNPPWFGKSVDGDHFGTVATAIPDYGVMLFVDYESGGAFGGAPKVWLYKYAAGTGIKIVDSTPPTTPTALSAQSVSSSQIDLTWIASTDNIGVTGYSIYQSGVQIGSSQAPSHSVAGLSPATTYIYSVAAYDAAGNLSARSSQISATTQAASTVKSPPPSGSADFQARCAATGVIRCVSFDSSSDLAGVYGDNHGRVPASAANGRSVPTLDTDVKASGAGSLKFTIPANSDQSAGGDYFINFSDDLLTQFGQNSDFYIQWRQRFSPELLSTKYAGGGGWKQAIITTGDAPGCTSSNSTNCQPSCTDIGVIVQNTNQRGFPQMYQSCGTQTGLGHIAYAPFEEAFGADIKMQNARPSPYCLYSQGVTTPKTYFPPVGNCFPYFPNEWMTFQVHIRVGPLVGDGSGRGTFVYQNSHIEMWVTREGQPSQQLFNWGPYNINAGSGTAKFGKIWLTAYHTGKDITQTNPVAYTWYDELIVSGSKIADPSFTSDGNQPPARPTSLTIK